MINQVPVQGYYFVKIFFFGLTEYHFAHLFTHATPVAIRPGHGRKSSSCRYNRQLESAHSQYRSLPVYFSFSVFFCSSIAFWMDEISVFRDAIVSCFSAIFSLWGQTPMFLFTRLYRLRFTLYIFSIKMASESIPNCLQIIFFNFPHDVFPL